MPTESALDTAKLSIAFTNRDLCARSGTCVGICPERAISLDEVGFPVIEDPSRCTQCGLCAKACPGGDVNFAGMSDLTFDIPSDPDQFDGRVRSTLVAKAGDETIRSGGAGGGIITALLWDMLQHGEVDGCVVTRMQHDQPWRGEPFIARTYDELLASQGSRYTLIPLNAIIQEIMESPGVFAFAALPCQTHGLRKAMHEMPELREKIHSIVGLFCGGGLEPWFVPELLHMRGVDPADLRDFQFRGGEWPGKIRALLKDGTIRNLHQSNYKDGAYNYVIGIYMPPRCATCLDGSCEFSDISVSDAWTRDEAGDFKYKAHSRLLVRTEVGSEIAQRAVDRGAILGHDVSCDPAYTTHRLQTKRKGIIARLRVDRLRARGLPVPGYDRSAPAASFTEHMTERVLTSMLALGKNRTFRFTLVKLLTSRAAVPLIRLRLWLKQRKYRAGRSR